ncbi:MAG: endolytic transglycosylase MltG, partial [Acidimicrobiia bacterium]
ADATIDPIAAWEGLFFPAKYPLAQDATPTEILGTMAQEFVTRMDSVNWSRLDALGITQREALVVASLIEREAGHDGERATVASVIYNRMEQGMRLQIDATVIYALGYNPGRVLAEHLKIDSMWNTYLIDGLPPTPIGTASIASLEAAANPESTEYLFYVLAAEDGSHAFATTYDGHQQNIADAKEAGVLP